MRILALDHVQIAMPLGGETAAREFYAGVLGFTEVPKPALLAVRGGVWFVTGNVNVHLGVESDFRAARKAHPAFQVDHLADLISTCERAGHTVTRDETLPGIERVHVFDPFGNRLEFLERIEPDPLGDR
jgi:catechol 2,3-dioxygenase-like lactoylglutathione lyase family enzyme